LGSGFAVKEFFINGRCTRNLLTNNVEPQSIDKAMYEKYLQKFIEEARTLASLNHPNIVKVNALFQEKNTAYMVMPYVEGKTLQKMVDAGGKLNYEMAINCIGMIADAVEYIHARDIKPGNIIITPENRAVLIDFGSAREFMQDKTQNHSTTLTPGYAPLERYSIVSRKGSYSDIYSLGATFYFALTGTKLMDAAARTTETMPAPKKMFSDIPDEANHTIMKAMELKPASRYQRVEEFMNDLLNKVPQVQPKQAKTSDNQINEQESKGIISPVFISVSVFVIAVLVWIIVMQIQNNTAPRVETPTSVIKEPIAQHSSCYETQRSRGIAAYNAGNYDSAIGYFETARTCEDVPFNRDLQVYINRCETAKKQKKDYDDEQMRQSVVVLVEEEAQKRKEAEREAEQQRQREAKAKQQQLTNKRNQNVSYSGTYKYRTTFIDDIGFDVPLRTEANVNSREKYKCPKDAIVFVIDNSDNIFSYVSINGYSGYVSTKTLKTNISSSSYYNNQSSRSNFNSYKFQTSFDNPVMEPPLREHPNVNSRELYRCPKNATVYVVDNSGEAFFKVRVNGYVGYVSKIFLARKR
jgi:serine/threonine protein kinase